MGRLQLTWYQNQYQQRVSCEGRTLLEKPKRLKRFATRSESQLLVDFPLALYGLQLLPDSRFVIWSFVAVCQRGLEAHQLLVTVMTAKFAMQDLNMEVVVKTEQEYLVPNCVLDDHDVCSSDQGP